MSSLKQMMNDVTKKVDIFISNIPGPKSEIYLAGNIVKEIIPIPTISYFNLLCLVASYNGQFFIEVFTKNKSEINAKVYSELVEEEIESLIK